MKQVALMMVAGLGAPAVANIGTLEVFLTFDRDTVRVGETATATVTAFFGFWSSAAHFGGVSTDFVASDPLVASAGPMTGLEWAMPFLGDASGGTPDGASLIGVRGMQMSLFGPVDTSNPFVIGRFEVVARAEGSLTYDAVGYMQTDILWRFWVNDPTSDPFAHPIYDVSVFHSETLTVVPAPGALGVLGVAWLAGRRRRGRPSSVRAG